MPFTNRYRRKIPQSFSRRLPRRCRCGDTLRRTRSLASFAFWSRTSRAIRPAAASSRTAESLRHCRRYDGARTRFVNHGRIPTLTPGAIRERHDAETFEHGERDQRDGRVTRIREVPTAHGIAITGTVDGGTPHEVYVTVESDSADPVIESDCSCEIGLDCRHVVAVLLEYAERGAAAVPERRAEEASVRRMSMLATSPTAPAAPLANVRAQLLFVLDVVAAANPGGASDGLGANLNRPGEGAAGRDRTE